VENLVDCIHIGIHKTGSTWLQLNGLLNHPYVNFLNKPNSQVEKLLVNEFIEINDFDYDILRFKEKFIKRLFMDNLLYIDKPKIISEENLSGNIYNGLNAKLLADRIFNTFGSVKIIIVLRNQLSFILSAYNNFLRHGGSLRLKNFLNDLNTPILLKNEKLYYHKIVSYYQRIFEKKNVKVLLYEQFEENQYEFMKEFSLFVGVEPYEIIGSKKKINASFSYPISNFVRFSNGIIGGRNRYINKFGSICSQFIKLEINIEKYFDDEILHFFAVSNKKLQELLTNIDLRKYGYLL
jgi:hypothetical protein